MNEKNTIKDLENQARNTRHLMDRLNRAAYGMTMAEIIKQLGRGNDDGDIKSGNSGETTPSV